MAETPDIESVHRDLGFANAYRQEFIKSLILIAGALFAFSVAFRPELRAVAHENLFWISWIGLGLSMLGGFTQLAAWERFYSSYQRFDWKGRKGKSYRQVITAIRRVALFFQVCGFVIGVAALGSFTAFNLTNFEKAKAAAVGITLSTVGRMSKWEKKANRAVKRLTGDHDLLRQFAVANLAAIADALEGKGPDAKKPDPRAGVRAVVNLASVHVPNFCERSRTNRHPAYLNSYDLQKTKIRLGSDPPKSHWKSREIVDHALASVHGRSINEVYFAAAELNGTGIRFYGDICLVLKPEEVPSHTKVLDRNSYDVLRAPFRAAVEKFQDESRRQAARRLILTALAGTCKEDLKTMGAIKVLITTGERDRRFSTGQISGGVLDDEDYIEILKIGSFDAKGVEATRVSAAEIALEGHVEQRLQSNPAASHPARQWLMERRAATKALADAGVDITVVTTPGRVKS
jgi:hypothetical protein